MRDLLLEIGTEEVPACYMSGILKQIEEMAKAKFTELRIGYQSARVIGTPRRLALVMTGVEEQQDDISRENRGPSVQVAFDAEHKPTRAAMGFAKGQNIAVEDLVEKDGYVYANVHETGRQTAEILKELMPAIIRDINFPRNMRWADYDMKFIRPLRWIVALFGREVIPFTIDEAEITSGNVTRGHRFMGPEAFAIEDAADYTVTMEKNFVIVDQEVRRSTIRKQIEEVAAANGGRAEITEDLLEEVVYLVEYPTALCGKFEDKYLELPPEAVITPMREHQRYFPVKAADGSLMPLFITIRNGGSEHLETVQHGNERVLRARLADAQFFFEEDRKHKLEDRLEKLKTVVFQEGLGTMYDKTLRLEALSAEAAAEMGMTDTKTVARAARLAKADLVTAMVCEFTELQGVMGRAYAVLDGEAEAVANAIDEHYSPRFAGDVLPQSEAGRAVGIADKLDNIVATFSRGLIPTGSQDPFALRRQALGIVNILIEAQKHISLKKLTAKSMDLLAIDDVEKRQSIQQSVKEFFELRIKNILSDENVRYDVVDAVLSESLDDIYGAYLRAKTVAEQVEAVDMTKAIQAFVRVGNLAKKAEALDMKPELFKVPAEQELYKAYCSTESAVESLLAGYEYKGAIDAMMDLTDPINEFFDDVMVMDKDEAVKNNRLALLGNMTAMIYKIADFSKVVEK